MTRRQAWLLAAGAVLLFSVCWRRLLLQNLIPVDGNVIAVSYPNWTLARSLWTEPRLPFWNPLRGMGTPHLADPVTSALYPPLWVLSALPDYGDFTRLWVVLHTLLSAGFLAALAHRRNKDMAATATAAALAGFNGFFMARIVFPHCLASQAWLPAILFFQETGSPVGLGACFAMQWLAGYPTFSVISALAALAWSLQQEKRGLSTLWRGGLIALGLAAVQILPFLEFLAQSSRGYAVNPGFAGQFSVAPLQLLKELLVPQWMAFAPQVAGDPAMETFYIGLPALAAAAWACYNGTIKIRLLTAACGFCLLMSLGRHLPGFSLLPFAHLFRSPSNWLLPATVGLALLASSGIARAQKSWRWALAGLIALDLAAFAQPVKSAWAKAWFLTEPPLVAQTTASWPRPTRIYHSEHLMRAWERGRLENEEDYLLMRDFAAPSFGSAFGLEDAANLQTMRLKRAEDYRARMAADPRSPLMDWAGISLVVSLDEAAGRVERGSVHLRPNPNAKPRVFLLESEGGKARLTHYSPGKAQAEIELEKSGTAVFSEMDYPGWRVFVDGKPAPRKRFEDAFISVVLTPGSHVVDFRFNPLSFWFGLAISLATMAGLFFRVRIS